LKDDFERYEKYLREQAQVDGVSMISSPGNKNSHIRQMIANSFLNLPYASSFTRYPNKKNSGSDLASHKGEGEHSEYASKSKQMAFQNGPHGSFKNHPFNSKMVSSKRLNPGALAKSVNMTSINKETSFVER
jgi:hypothetical protein